MNPTDDARIPPPAPAGGNGLARRRMLKVLAAAGAGGAVFGRAVQALAQDDAAVTVELIRQAEWVSGLNFTDDDRTLMLEGMNDMAGSFARLRAIDLDNGVAPALVFAPVSSPGQGTTAAASSVRLTESAAARKVPTGDDLAFAPVSELAPLLAGRQITSTDLTRHYLERIHRHDPVLRCVITLTEDLAMAQAERADSEIRQGRYRGPLHGIPWGAKDLLAVPGYPTTWGATPYRTRVRTDTATVVRRLEEAGAVLVAKTSVGALAWGDVWFDATTKNPWNTEQGSSGSSAGSASSTAAGLVGFAIGTETWGSIVSPCTRCGATGLRPTFGRVSRHGAMALSWSMDKIGPISRSVEDCALVFAAIQGADGLDTTVTDRPFHWPLGRDVRTLRVGYVRSLFEAERGDNADSDEARQAAQEWRQFDLDALEVLRGLGIRLEPVELPSTYPVDALGFILTAEAAAAFDHLTRTGADDTLVRQVGDAWPNVFRQGQMIPAVEYIRANRVRSLVMAEMEELMSTVDAYISPSFSGNNLLLTNLTGHPQVVLPNGFRSGDGTPTSITFTGRLHGESELLALAHAYQQATSFHRRRPPLDGGGKKPRS